MKYTLTKEASELADKLDILWFSQPRDGDAGYDLRTVQSIIPYGIKLDTQEYLGDITKVHTGVKLEIPPGYVGLVLEKNSIGEMGVSIRGGVIDSAYRGEIVVMLQGLEATGIEFKRGQKIAQLVLIPFIAPDVEGVSVLGNSVRGDDGFGSTGAI